MLTFFCQLKATRVNNDNYVSRGMQTFNNPQKSKDLQATAVKFANANTMATTWLIHDAFEREEGKVLEGDGGYVLLFCSLPISRSFPDIFAESKKISRAPTVTATTHSPSQLQQQSIAATLPIHKSPAYSAQSHPSPSKTSTVSRSLE